MSSIIVLAINMAMVVTDHSVGLSYIVFISMFFLLGLFVQMWKSTTTNFEHSTLLSFSFAGMLLPAHVDMHVVDWLQGGVQALAIIFAILTYAIALKRVLAKEKETS